MKTYRLFTRDFKIGICKKWFLYLLPAALAFVQVRECFHVFDYFNSSHILSGYGTILDYWMYMTQGMVIYYFDPKTYFTVPTYWFIFQIFASYLVIYYAFDDFTANARVLYIAARSRRSFWNCKCLWCVMSIFLYYVIYMISVTGFAMLYHAEFSFRVTDDFLGVLFGSEAVGLRLGKIVFCTLLVPFLVTLSLCLAQVLLGFLTTPITSFSIISGIYIVSAYYTKWFLPGSFTMWLRSSLIFDKGVNTVSGLILALTILLLTWLGGETLFDEKDVF